MQNDVFEGWQQHTLDWLVVLRHDPDRSDPFHAAPDKTKATFGPKKTLPGSNRTMAPLDRHNLTRLARLAPVKGLDDGAILFD